jgi:hypothetical protein
MHEIPLKHDNCNKLLKPDPIHQIRRVFKLNFQSPAPVIDSWKTHLSIVQRIGEILCYMEIGTSLCCDTSVSVIGSYDHGISVHPFYKLFDILDILANYTRYKDRLDAWNLGPRWVEAFWHSDRIMVWLWTSLAIVRNNTCSPVVGLKIYSLRICADGISQRSPPYFKDINLEVNV